MENLGYKLSLGNPRIAAIVSGSVFVIQFSIETIEFLCLAVYAVAFTSTIAKVFYALAAIASPLLLLLSILFVYSLSKDNYKWMVPWLVAQLLVSLSELILTFIAFIVLNDLHSIFDFFSSAWHLAQFQAANQLYVGFNESSCIPQNAVTLLGNGQGISSFVLITQQGASGIIAGITLLILFKNIFNFATLYISYIQYHELLNGRGHQRNYAPSNSSTYYDPHVRGSGHPKRNHQFSSISAISN